MMLRKLSLFALLCLLVLLPGCLHGPDRGVTQYSTLPALSSGIFDGEFTVRQIKQAGDFGLGTFNHLDGEMIVLDGVVYQAKTDGSVVKAADDMLVPFVTVLPLRPEKTVDLAPGLDVAGMTAALDSQLASKNLFSAARIDGTFSYLKIRTVPRQEPPFRNLAEVAKEQTVTELTNIAGTLIVLRMPPYFGELNLAGYHMHFISNDRQKAGHVLAVTTGPAKAQLDILHVFRLELPTADAFLDGQFGETAGER